MTVQQLDIQARELQQGDVVVGGTSRSSTFTGEHQLTVEFVTAADVREGMTSMYVTGLGTVRFDNDKVLTVKRDVPVVGYLDGTIAMNTVMETYVVRVNGEWIVAASGESSDWVDDRIRANPYMTITYEPRP